MVDPLVANFVNILLSSERDSVSANEKGTGLGLILCHELVRENGGQIWAESTLSEGSRFYFTLPSSIRALAVLDEDSSLKQN